MRKPMKQIISLNLALLTILIMLLTPINAGAVTAVESETLPTSWIEVDGEVYDASVSQSGGAWRLSYTTLYLDDYDGGPIRTNQDLFLNVTGACTVSADAIGSAISSSYTYGLRIKFAPDSSLTVNGSTDPEATGAAISVPKLVLLMPGVLTVNGGMGQKALDGTLSLYGYDNTLLTFESGASSTEIDTSQVFSNYASYTGSYLHIAQTQVALHFDHNDGTETVTSEAPCAIGTAAELAPPELTREGYLLAGWSTSKTPESSDQYHIGGETLTLDQSKRYYAIWEELPADNTYIILDGNGAKLSSGKSRTVLTPTEDIYTLPDAVGWSDDPKCVPGAAETTFYFGGSTCSLTSGSTLYVVRSSGASSSMVLYGGGGTTKDGKTVALVPWPADNRAPAEGEPFSRDGYVQTGWAVSRDSTRPDYYCGENFDASYAALYATWAERPTTGVVYHLMGGYYNDAGYPVSAYAESLAAGSVSLITPYGGNYFSGWSLTPNGMPISELTVAEKECVDLYALWGVKSDVSVATVMTSSGNMRLYQIVSSILVGDTVVDPSDTESGIGWHYENAVLSLNGDYEGAPIQAARDLVVEVTGDVYISDGDGAPLTAVGDCVTCYVDQGALTLTGGTYGVKCKNFCNGPSGTLTATGGTAAICADYVALTSGYPLGVFTKLTAGATADSASAVTEYNNECYLLAETPQITVTYYDGETQLRTEALRSNESITYAPARDGCCFLGWTKTTDGSGMFSTVCDFTQDTALYAQWSSTSGVTLHYMGGYRYENSQQFCKQALAAGEDGKYTLPDASNADYDLMLLGWKIADSDSTAAEPTYNFDTDRSKFDDLYWAGESYSFDPGTVLCAVWCEETVNSPGFVTTTTAILHGTGGKNENDQPNEVIRFVGESSGGDLVMYEDSALPVDFTRTGKTLAAWNTSEYYSGTEYYPGQLAGSANSYYAQWEPKVPGSAMLYDYAGELSNGAHYLQTTDLDSALSSNGFSEPSAEFGGWYELFSDSEEPVSDFEADGRYFAKWNYLCATYYLSDGTVDEPVYAGSYGFSVKSAEYRSGFLFDGWNTSPDFTGDWYAAGKKIVLTQNISLYPHYIDTSSIAVLLRADTGGLDGHDYLEYSLSQEFTLPSCEGLVGWYDSADDTLYQPGQAVSFTGQTMLFGVYLDRGVAGLDANLMSLGNGGTTETGATCIYTGYASSGSLSAYAAASDSFTRANHTLTGWNTRADGNGKSYQPGAYIGYQIHNTLFAQWRNNDAVGITFTDEKSVKTAALLPNDVITLPTPTRAAHTFAGWRAASDGTLYPAGDYTVTGAESFTAEWTRADKLIVDGQEYDPNADHSGAGWHYDYNYYSSRVNIWLHLEQYSGGAILIPGGADGIVNIRFSGENTLTAAEGKAAIECGCQCNIGAGAYGGYVSDYSLTLTGGSGSPAIYAEERIQLGCGNVTATGGGGGGALLSDNRKNLDNSYYDPYSFNACSKYAGEDKDSAAALGSSDKYDGEAYIRTEPVVHTLAIDGAGGKYHGRTKLSLDLDEGISVPLEEYAFERSGYAFTGFKKQGNTITQATIYEDTTITAQYEYLGFDEYVTFRANGYYDAQTPVQYVRWSADGVTVPSLTMDESSEYALRSWQIYEEYEENGESYNRTVLEARPGDVVKVPAGTVFEGDFHSKSDGQYGVIYDANGRTFADGRTYMTNNRATTVSRMDSISNSNDGLNVRYYSLDKAGTDKIGFEETVPGADTGFVTVYAQWETAPFTVTVPSSGKITLDESSYEMWLYGKENGSYPKAFGWRTADWSAIYPSGTEVSLPAGTVLYSVCGYSPTCVLLDDGVSAGKRIVGSNGVDDVRLTAASLGLTREGYHFTGWNTNADGSGTHYAANGAVSFPYERHDLPDWTGSNADWQMLNGLGAYLSSDWDSATQTQSYYYVIYTGARSLTLYAQWEKDPDLTIEVPEEMLEAVETREDAKYLVAFYKDNRMVDARMVSADIWEIEIYLKESGYDNYTIFCTGGGFDPLTTSAKFDA